VTTSLPAPYERYQKLADLALMEWVPGARVVFYPLEASGHSGSAVLKIDLRNIRGNDLEAGQYILKLSDYSAWLSVENEVIAHARAEKQSGPFATAHLPKLRKSFTPPREENLGYAMLYEIAGSSLDSYTATDTLESPGFLEVCGHVTTDLLRHWAESEPCDELSPYELLKQWLEYRLDSSAAPELHAFANSIGPNSYAVDGDSLPNPLSFCKFAQSQAWASRPILYSLLHNDLHGGNLLVPRRVLDSAKYWLIDFAQCTQFRA
jgi:hypothetical protein